MYQSFFVPLAPKEQNQTDMKRLLLTTLVWAVNVLITFAVPVSEQAAKKAAQDFIRQQWKAMTRGEAQELTRAVTGVADGEDAGIFVFNAEDGYVVISADDKLPAILAYGYGSPYDARTAPIAMKEMLEAYHYAATATAKTRATVPTHADISPLIKTTWDQETPYNKLCPNGYPTGCVATATAQIMYYHQYPNTYEWGKMKTGYKSSDTGEAVDAVARLMADVGEKVFMSYGQSESSARFLDACEALRYDFGYSETTEYVERNCYTAKSWDELVYNELAASRPVLMGAQSMTPTGEGGHAFIIDGYEVKGSTGYFHVNWGWSGHSDDYFLISVLNPTYQYAGGHAGSSGYSYEQNAIVGIQPAATPMAKTCRFITDCCYIDGDKGTYTRTSTSVDFPNVVINFSVFNLCYPKEARRYDVAVALYKDRDLIKILDQGSLGEAMGYGTGGRYHSNSVSLGKDLSDGTYQIRILSRETGKTEWTWAIESACRYVELTINGNTMTTTTYGNLEEFDNINDLTVNSVNVSGSKKVGEPLTITINVTNNHVPSNSPLFLWGNASLAEGTDKYQCLSGGGTNLDPGETGDLVLEYTPQRAGTFNFVLSASSNNTKNPLYSFSEEITGTYLSLELVVDGATPQSDGTNKVDGNTFKGVVKLSNYGSVAYDDNITFKLAELDMSVGNFKFIGTSNQKITIGIGETKEISFSYENLTNGLYYALIVGYQNGSSTVYMNMEDDLVAYNQFYQMTESTGIGLLKADAPDADVYNMNGVRLGKAADLKNLPKGIYIINKKKVIR